MVSCKDGSTAKKGRGACSHHSGVAAGPDSPLLDVGAGASTLVDGLLDAGYSDIKRSRRGYNDTLVFISARQLEAAGKAKGQGGDRCLNPGFDVDSIEIRVLSPIGCI
jgi:hypothetical protein